MNTKISIIVPVYNTEKYLTKCLDSIISQTLNDIEIIIINDFSPDNSRDVIKKYQEKDSRITFIDKQKNEGVGAARNDGIKVATGKYVCFMDSDDLYPSINVLEHLYEAAEKNSVLIAGGKREDFKGNSYFAIDSSFSEYGMTFSHHGLMQYKEYQYDYGYTCYLFSRELLINHNIFFPTYSRYQDPPFFVRAMSASETYFFLDEPVYRYRILPNNNKYTMKKTIDLLEGLKDNLRFSKDNNLPKLHYLSACRLDKEASFMAIKNYFTDDEESYKLIYSLLQASSLVDQDWLNENGYNLKNPFVIDAIKHLYTSAKKYETLRNRRSFKAIKKMVKRCHLNIFAK